MGIETAINLIFTHPIRELRRCHARRDLRRIPVRVETKSRPVRTSESKAVQDRFFQAEMIQELKKRCHAPEEGR
jgi:hypothetical protein